jgi:hypothetical protein
VLKFNLPYKRKEAPKEKSADDSKKLYNLMMNSIKSNATQIQPDHRFGLLSFIEEWRRNKKLANEEVMVGLGDKNKIKIGGKNVNLPPKRLQFNKNLKIVRTLKFESNIFKDGLEKKCYHILSDFNSYFRCV